MSLAARRVAAAVLLVVGSIGVCCAILPVLLPRLIAEDIARVERLQPLSFAALEDGTPGREAMVEGTLSPRNRASPEGFIVYTRSVPFVEADGDRTWREVEAVRPPLLVELPGGLVRVVGDYTTSGTMPARVDEPTLRIEGLRAGDTVVAIGTLVEGREGIELRADVLGVGTREQYLESSRQGVLFLNIFGWVLLGGGLVLAAGGLILLLRVLTEPTSPAYP